MIAIVEANLFVSCTNETLVGSLAWLLKKAKRLKAIDMVQF